MTTPTVSQGVFDRAERLANTAASLMQATIGQQSAAADVMRQTAQAFAERAMAMLGTPPDSIAAPEPGNARLNSHPTLQQYLQKAFADGHVDHSVRVVLSADGKGQTHFCIHPTKGSGDTIQYTLESNSLYRPTPTPPKGR